MTMVLTVLVVLALASVVLVLGAGLIGLARGMDPHRSNRLMQWRILLQGAALVLFLTLSPCCGTRRKAGSGFPFRGAAGTRRRRARLRLCLKLRQGKVPWTAFLQ